MTKQRPNIAITIAQGKIISIITTEPINAVSIVECKAGTCNPITYSRKTPSEVTQEEHDDFIKDALIQLRKELTN